MLENIMEVCSQKGEVNMLNAMTTCTNKVLMSILFGKDLKHLFYNTYEYEGPNGTEHLNISEYFGKMGHDLSRESVNPLTLFFPLLTKFNPFGIWKKNQENTQRFYSAVKDIISRSQDEESLWNQISSLNQFTEDEIFSDLIVLIGAGSETAAHTLSLIHI